MDQRARWSEFRREIEGANADQLKEQWENYLLQVMVLKEEEDALMHQIMALQDKERTLREERIHLDSCKQECERLLVEWHREHLEPRREQRDKR